MPENPNELPDLTLAEARALVTDAEAKRMFDAWDTVDYETGPYGLPGGMYVGLTPLQHRAASVLRYGTEWGNGNKLDMHGRADELTIYYGHRPSYLQLADQMHGKGPLPPPGESTATLEPAGCGARDYPCLWPAGKPMVGVPPPGNAPFKRGGIWYQMRDEAPPVPPQPPVPPVVPPAPPATTPTKIPSPPAMPASPSEAYMRELERMPEWRVIGGGRAIRLAESRRYVLAMELWRKAYGDWLVANARSFR